MAAKPAREEQPQTGGDDATACDGFAPGFFNTQVTASERVDVELVLLADASGSIDVRIQRWLGVRSSGQRSRGAGPAKRRSRSIIPTASLANG